MSTCGCNQQNLYGSSGFYLTNSNSTSCAAQRPCNGCLDIIKGLCLLYGGVNLTSTGINKNDDFDTIIAKLDVIKGIQDSKNAKILANLNDINARLNTLEGGSHAAYTLL